MMLSCRDVTKLISESMDRTLPFGKRLGVRIHLTLCRFCARYERQLLSIRAAARRLAAAAEDPAEWVPNFLSVEVRERIRRSFGE